MIATFPIARDERLYCAWPDVARLGDRLICVFAACTHHGSRDFTEIRCVTSDDRGRSWSAPQAITTSTSGDPTTIPYWNCPRITALEDGRLIVVVDRTIKDAGNFATNHLLESSDGGRSWSEPREIPVVGIVPDRVVVLGQGPHAGRWLLTAHQKTPQGPWCSEQRVWLSDDAGQTWEGPILVAADRELWLCEASICEMPQGELVCFLRENSFRGLDAFKTISRDGGLTWGPLIAFPLPGCHRPVAGVLQDGRVLITHRFMQGGQGWVGWWTQNTFAAFTDVASCLASERQKAHTRIVPLDFDRSEKSDCGYTGWVQFDDGEIYIVNYCVDDWRAGQIRGYTLDPRAVCLPLPI
jgi:hypothetical protein